MKKMMIVMSFLVLSLTNAFASDACKALDKGNEVEIIRSETYEASRTYWLGVGQSDYSGICQKVISKCRKDGFQGCEENYEGWSYEILRGATIGQKCITYGTKKITKVAQQDNTCKNISNCLMSLLKEDEVSKEKVELAKTLLEINNCKKK